MDERVARGKMLMADLMQECIDAGLTVYYQKELTDKEKESVIEVMYHRKWFYVTNGKVILSIGYDGHWDYWRCSFIYSPTIENGRSCALLDSDCMELTLDMIKEFLSIDSVEKLSKYNFCIDPKHIVFYNSVDEWFSHLHNKEKYEKHSKSDLNIYCVEFMGVYGVCRFAVPVKLYNELLSCESDSDKVSLLQSNFETEIKGFVRQFITQDENILIGCLDGEEMEF